MFSATRCFSRYIKPSASTWRYRNATFSHFYSTHVQPCEISSVGDDAVDVQWAGQAHATPYSYLWLRDNCPCPQCLHPSSRQKLHSSADVPLDIKPSSIKLINDKAEIVWDKPLRHGKDKGHVSHFPLDFLKTYQSNAAAEKFRFHDIKPRTWNADEYALDWVAYDDYMNTEEGLHTVVQRLSNSGLVFLRGVPTTDEACTQVAERIGPIQETFYGRDFDVKNVAKAINVAYTSIYLGFHMDLMYLDCPPGVQLLHSLKNSVTGGASIFVDSFRAVELLKEKDPEAYTILKETPVTFHYINNGHHMYYKRPTIVPGSAWDSHVNYAPQFQGPMDGLTPADAKKFYSAFQKLADVIEDDSLRFQLTLQPGDLVLFANRRVLHGRTAFDPTSGDRHLKGTYLTLDSLKDKFRVLSAKFGHDPSI